MRFLFLDIITDDPSFRKQDEKMLEKYGGHKGLLHRCLGLEHSLEDLTPGLIDIKMLRSSWARLKQQKFHGVVIAGSVVDVDSESKIKPWQFEVFNFIRMFVGLNIPVLGFCGGHQYGARALTDDRLSVIKNHKGEHFGTSTVIFTEYGKKHPLFKECSDGSLFQWSHSCIVNKIPKGSVLLASHSMTSNAAFQFKSFIGLQWHPEIGALPESEYGVSIMHEIALSKRETIQEGILQQAPDSSKIFKNWLRMVEKRRDVRA